MRNNKMRDEFEADAKTMLGRKRAFHQNEDGSYVLTALQYCWEGWQAALAAQAQEAPSEPSLYVFFGGDREHIRYWTLHKEAAARREKEFGFAPTAFYDRASSSRDAIPTQAARDVLAERQRQISVEGMTLTHDDEHGNGALAMAAACYCAPLHRFHNEPPTDWPWDRAWWKPGDRRRELVKAGALILAEIERLDRAVPSTQQGDDNE